jgi:serine/threonine protein kinase
MSSVTLLDLPRFPIQTASRSSSSADTLVDDLKPSYIQSASFSLQNLVPICKVGSGAFGNVFKVTDISFDPAAHSGQTPKLRCYALKVIPKLADNADSVWRERETLLETTGSDWLCGFVGSWQDAANYYLLMDFVEGGDLMSLTTPVEESRSSLRARILDDSVDECLDITPRQVQLIVAELIVALEELHKRKIIHRDIKPRNILFDADGHVVLGDFGISRNFNLPPSPSAVKEPAPTLRRRMRNMARRYGKDQIGKQHTNAAYGSPAYMAPEVWMGIPYSYEADFWSVGVLMYFLLVGRFPFDLDDCVDDSEIRDAIFWAPFNLNWDLCGSDRVDSVTLDFMERVLKKASTRRPTVDEMKRHPYFDGVDFEKLKAREYCGPMANKVSTRAASRVQGLGASSVDCGLLNITIKDGHPSVSSVLGFDFDTLEPFPRHVSSVRSKFIGRVRKLLRRI